MALQNNLVVAKQGQAALAEAMAQRQPGDRMVLNDVEVEVVENLAEKASFDVIAVGSARPKEDESAGDEAEESPLAATVLGVMSKKKGKS